MSGRLHRLGNGLTVAVDPMPGVESVAVGLYAMVGSRSEPLALSGLAHLVEHMVFKGAGSRDTRQLAEAIEDVGGYLNAWTARDQTAFHGRAMAKDCALLVELLADLVRAPHVGEEELEREKGVILSELGEILDSPDELVIDHLFSVAFDNQPLGRPVLGTAESIRAATRADCLAWLADELVPTRLILAASGKVDEDGLLAQAERLFGDMAERPGAAIAPARFTGGSRRDPRSFEQAHWSLAFPGLAAGDPAVPALAVFVQALGGGTSSRLFQQLREERGMAYSIYAWSQAFADAGIVTIGCAADRARAGESMALARQLIAETAETLSEEELRRARAQVEAGLVMALETPQGRADQMARSIEVFGRILTVDELLGQIEAVDVAAARGAGVRLLDGPVALASIGAGMALAA